MGETHYRRILPCALVLLVCQITLAQEDDEEPYLPGLIASYYQTGEPIVERIEAVVASHGSEFPDEHLVREKSYSVTWRGVLLIPDDGEYQFHVHGRGNVEIILNGVTLLRQGDFENWLSTKPQQLTYGPVPIEISYRAAKPPAQLNLFWSSDRFEREPVPARALVHDRTKTIASDFDRGRILARALRCEVCHTSQEKPTADPIPAPALDQLSGNLHRDWLINWLRDDGSFGAFGDVDKPPRRMPFFNIPQEDAELLADWLLGGDVVKKPAASAKEPPQPDKKPKDSKTKPRTPAELKTAGKQLFHTKGCLACHTLGEFRDESLFGGGSLNDVAAKRPRDFFSKWLQKPESLNRDHRMPVFDLTADEREALGAFLSSLGKESEGDERREARGEGRQEKAWAVARKYRCDECHRLPNAAEVAKLAAPPAIAELTAKSDWKKTCVKESFKEHPGQPMLWFSNKDGQALATYVSQRKVDKVARKPDGAQLLIENNCLACHSREPQISGILPQKLSDKLVRLAEEQPELASQLPALTPPSLNSVGDKLTDAALANAITRAGPAHRPYLQVQMPRFRLSKEQTQTLAGHFIDIDRIPDYERKPASPEPTAAQLAARSLAGKRLVGTDGFSCTACHQVGSVQPVKAPPNARGPTLSMMQDRLRKTWFDRWVRNPARIVPRMEMPSVQVPVRGVLQDNLHDQLAAVWQVLNTPGFEPPLPEPVRTLRFYSSEDNSQKQPLVITDLIEHDGQTLERAALIGLPNRHNILFDFATNRLLSWSQGDLARQRTKGKNWYWEPAGSPLLTTGVKQSELAIEIEGELYVATTGGQWLVEPLTTILQPNLAYVTYKLNFQSSKLDSIEAKPVSILVQQFFESIAKDTPGEFEHGFRRRYQLSGLPAKSRVHLRLLAPTPNMAKPNISSGEFDTRLIADLGVVGNVTVKSDVKAKLEWQASGTVVITPGNPAKDDKLLMAIEYRAELPRDEYHAPRLPPVVYEQPPIVLAPGFVGERLSLPPDVMPTALAVQLNGDLFVTSLKGQVLWFERGSWDSPPAVGRLLAEGLAAPYGIWVDPERPSIHGPPFVDVITKTELLRITPWKDGKSATYKSLAAGWGYTADYHDWAVGLPRGEFGEYYLAFPCYQDNRTEAAKRLRGTVLQLSPHEPNDSNPYSYTIRILTRGHRFPMGMALNARNELFVSDNQGNYNPFNELNYIRPGRHFGFINKGEDKPAESISPAIDIPHPWTRSVNGICFLDSRKAFLRPGTKNFNPQVPGRFGPLEGHLVGCEYDTRRLIRMSLQKVGDDYQGCAYPLTLPAKPEEAPLGPICCEASPRGELFIGSIRDSGWGAGNNIGEVIRVKVDPAKFGHGLAEMRATAKGFELDFFSPVEKVAAEQIESYSLSSYRRESTPAYGGNDIDRRTEKITKVTLSADRKRVMINLNNIRAGHVYELRLKSLASAGETFFPAEAHYTLRQLVK